MNVLILQIVIGLLSYWWIDWGVVGVMGRLVSAPGFCAVAGSGEWSATVRRAFALTAGRMAIPRFVEREGS